MNPALRALASVYGGVTRLRNYLYDNRLLPIYRSALPVISIGNISVGGNGKTPLCLYLAQELARRSLEPVILSRGYGGSARGPRLVKPTDAAAEVGDEPLLMARVNTCPVVVARDRYAGTCFIEEQALGRTVILDDGFQHRRLARDLDIVCAYVGSDDSIQRFLDGELLPLGRFREDRDHALRRAHVIVLAERRTPAARSEPDQRLFALVPPGIQIYRSFLEIQGAFALRDGAALPPQRVIALCGIANPEGFLKTLEEGGFSVAESVCFSDHHLFSRQELDAARHAVPGLPVVCTQKDAVRITPDCQHGIYELRVGMKMLPADAFVTQVARVVMQSAQHENPATAFESTPGGDQ